MSTTTTTTLPLSSFHRIFFRPDVLSYGFGAAVAMWAFGYIFHLPGLELPSPALFFSFIVCLIVFGYGAARYTPAGWKAGLAVGLWSSLLNLLVLGSVISGDEPNQLVPSALIYIPGFFVAAVLIASAGSMLGLMRGGMAPTLTKGDALMAKVACVATFILLTAGGLVTSYDAGLAVVDWPNTFGYNMFLYPLSRMTGGIYYEHAHRLIGALVGLATIALCYCVFALDERKWVKYTLVFAVILVIVQGIMGGLRVTGEFTLNTDWEQMTPNNTLAVVHGVTGQLFFALMGAIAAFLSPRWLSDEKPISNPASAIDRWLGPATILMIVSQLILGAVYRHVSSLLIMHITWAGVVFMVIVAFGVRAWGLYPRVPTLGRIGLSLIAVTGVQILLGFIALWAIYQHAEDESYAALEVLAPTAHQATGAIVLFLTTLLTVWVYRLTQPTLDPEMPQPTEG